MEAYNLTHVRGETTTHSALRKNIILHPAKHTQFITPQTGTSVRETSTLKHGSKYWKLLETSRTSLLCFLNAGFYSASSIFVSLRGEPDDDATLLLSEEITSERRQEKEREREERRRVLQVDAELRDAIKDRYSGGRELIQAALLLLGPRLAPSSSDFNETCHSLIVSCWLPAIIPYPAFRGRVARVGARLSLAREGTARIS